MLACPECDVSLRRQKTPRGPVHMCPSCTGFMIPVQVLRKSNVSRSLVTQAWSQAKYGRGERGRACPYCLHPMRIVTASTEGYEVTIDVCPECYVMWFDPGELDEMTDAALSRPGLLTMQKVKRPGAPILSGHPNAAWKYLPALLGMPVEMDADTPASFPLITILVFLACAAVFYLTAGDLDTAAVQYGFFSNDILRDGGSSLLASFFLHGSLLHLISNMYFLLVFGNNVESDLGGFRFLMLLLGAHLGGYLLHASFLYDQPQGAIPLIGASAGISGIIAYYAISFPRHRIGFLFLFFWWIRISALAAIVLFIILQLIGAYYQLIGFSPVSYLAHVGGLVAGLAAGFTARYHRTQAGHEI